jgi:hypothetical protein
MNRSPADMAAEFGGSEYGWQRKARTKAVQHHRDGRRVWFTDEDVAAYLAQTQVAAHDPLRSQTAGSKARGRPHLQEGVYR